MGKSVIYKHLHLLILLLCSTIVAYSQGTSYYEDNEFDPYQRRLYFVGKDRPHTTIRNYKLDELNKYFDTDSVLYVGVKKLVNTCAKIINNFLNTDFLSWRSSDSAVYVAINPMMDLEVGKDYNQTENKNTWTNSRGFYLNGNLGKNFWFYLDFSENQAIFSGYMTNFIDSLRVVPCTATPRHINTLGKEYDWMFSSGYICFNAGKWIDFQVGKTHTFIGDGYRSLLLSDAAEPVPTFKMNVTFLSVKYTMMVSQLRAIGNTVTHNGNKTKYSFTHFLDWNMGKRFTLGLFENVTQATWRITGENRSIDWEYLNPFVIFRPGELSAGSPDKMIVGLTNKFVCNNHVSVYGQLFFNEFILKELVKRTRHWDNKYGFQIGARTFDIFGVDGLDLQMELNSVRPFCYTQYNGMATYTHHGVCMGHSLGANLKEIVGVINYHYGRAAARLNINATKYGDDFPNDTLSYGHNPNIDSNSRNKSYNVSTLQGLETKLLYAELTGSYIINPRSMMTVTAGLRYRKRQSNQTKEEAKQAYIALRWNIRGRQWGY